MISIGDIRILFMIFKHKFKKLEVIRRHYEYYSTFYSIMWVYNWEADKEVLGLRQYMLYIYVLFQTSENTTYLSTWTPFAKHLWAIAQKTPIKPTETRNCIYQSGTWTLLTRRLQQQDSRQRLEATTWTEHLDALYRCSHPRRPQRSPRRCHQTCLRNTHSDVMQFITNAVLTTHSLTAMPDERGS